MRIGHIVRQSRIDASMARSPSIFFLATWVIATTGGLSAMLVWQNTPAPRSGAGTDWPVNFPLRLDPNAASLVMVVHPKCPCSRASFAELVKVMTRATAPMRVAVLFYKPVAEPETWVEGSLYSEAKAIPGLQVLSDPDGQWATRLGAIASGHVFLFNHRGSLLFNGGITAGRGHEGENPGSETILALLSGSTPGFPSTHTFGCPVTEAPGAATISRR
jgi:hypothetical protein